MSFKSADPVLFYGKSHVTASLGSNHPEVGTLVTFEDGNTYRWVYNESNTDISPTYAVQINSAATGYSVTVTNATNTGKAIGVVKHATLTTATYGWVLVQGFGTIEMGADNSAAVRANIYVGADGTGAGAAASEHPYATIVSAAASGASAGAYISCF